MNSQKTSFTLVTTALMDQSRPFPPKLLHRFSDIDTDDLAEVKIIWPQVDPNRRASLLEDLEELAEADTLVCLDDFSRFALTDADPRARATAIRLLWESQDKNLVPIFINMMQNDSDEIVRAAASSALGLYIYLGEIDEIPEKIFKNVEESLLKKVNSSDASLVRRRALESLGYSGREEIPAIIKTAYDSKDSEWVASALFAMSRSADSRWEKAIVSDLTSPEPIIQFEAVRAAAHLDIHSAYEPLLKLLEDKNILSEDVYRATIWSISQIGGEGVQKRLDELYDESDDEEEAEFIESAIENLVLATGFSFNMLDFDAIEKFNQDDSEDQDSPDEIGE